jgi:hypothetical protein
MLEDLRHSSDDQRKLQKVAEGVEGKHGQKKQQHENKGRTTRTRVNKIMNKRAQASKQHIDIAQTTRKERQTYK